MNKTTLLASAALAALSALPPTPAQAQVISACVNQRNGDLRIVAPGTACGPNQSLLEWNHPVVVPPTPAPALNVVFERVDSEEGSAGRVFCPAGTTVVGGGAYAYNQAPLTYSVPIATPDGQMGWSLPAIGWQAAATDWSRVAVFVGCARLQ